MGVKKDTEAKCANCFSTSLTCLNPPSTEPSSTQTEPLESADSKSEREATAGPAPGQKNGGAKDQSEKPAPAAPGVVVVEERPESTDPVSSSSSGEEETPGEDSARAHPRSPAEGSVSVSVVGSSVDSSETPAEEHMEED